MKTEDILEKLWTEDFSKALYFLGHKLHKAPKEDLQDIVSDSLEVLKNKYLDKQKVSSQEDARKVLYGIIKIHIKKYKRIKADEAWRNAYGDRFDPEQTFDEFVSANKSDIALYPPSYYYDKKRHKEWREKNPGYHREYYKKNQEKLRAAARQENRRKAQSNARKMKQYWEMKKDPIKWREYLDKVNKRKRENRKSRRDGTYVDKRLYENRVKLNSPNQEQ